MRMKDGLKKEKGRRHAEMQLGAKRLKRKQRCSYMESRPSTAECTGKGIQLSNWLQDHR